MGWAEQPEGAKAERFASAELPGAGEQTGIRLRRHWQAEPCGAPVDPQERICSNEYGGIIGDAADSDGS